MPRVLPGVATVIVVPVPVVLACRNTSSPGVNVSPPPVAVTNAAVNPARVTTLVGSSAMSGSLVRVVKQVVGGDLLAVVPLVHARPRHAHRPLHVRRRHARHAPH